MKLLLERGSDDGASIPGKLAIDGVFFCYTLEPSAQRPQYPAIPAGTFPVELLQSFRFGELTPHLRNVPGRSLIEIHPGNDSHDTEGCILVGESEGSDWVGSSRVAFQQLMAVLESATDGLSIEIRGAADPTFANAASGAGGGNG